MMPVFYGLTIHYKGKKRKPAAKRFPPLTMLSCMTGEVTTDLKNIVSCGDTYQVNQEYP